MTATMEKARGDVMSRFFERFDPEFGRFMEAWWPFGTEERIRIEQEMLDDALVVRAELPGIDPDKDVEISVSDGYLHLRAERRSESKEEKAGRAHSEFRYGSYSRTVALPPGVNLDDITAAYRDGILEIRVPTPVEAKPQVQRIAVTKS